jgi:hypothetical protein
MTIDDQVLLKLTAWRENRGGGALGMQSVMNVVLNRAKRHGTTPYAECIKRLQFSSISAQGDPELTLWPVETDADWIIADALIARALAGDLNDITGGATVYYAPKAIKSTQMLQLPTHESVPFPKDWDRTSLEFTRIIANQVFFIEKE